MKNFMRFLCAAMLCVSFAACTGEEGEGSSNSGDDSNYSTLILGTWQVDLMSVNGQNMTPPNMQLSFYENGGGLMNDGGETEHNDFTWSISGSTVNVTTDKYQFSFTIDSVTATECGFHGNFMEMDGHEITGDIRFHMTKVGGGTPDNPDNPDPDDPNWVNLGLPSGLLWATCNVGATSPEDTSYFFAWGETVAKNVYDCGWSIYAYGSNYTQLTKYCNDAYYGLDGYTDNLTILEPTDDAATAIMGNGARTPTKEEWQELIDNTTAEWTTLNGINGCRFTAANGNSIFLPAAGERNEAHINHSGSFGYYWSASLDTEDPYRAWCSILSASNQLMGSITRCDGLSVRAVKSAN